MRAARSVVEQAAHGSHEHTYGVNTGFGRFVSKQIPQELTEELQLRLLRSHACGVGEPYPDVVVRAAMLLRANALAKGNSGARVETVAVAARLPEPGRAAAGAGTRLGRCVGRSRAARASRAAAGRRGRGVARRRARRGRGRACSRRPPARAAACQRGTIAHQRHAVHGCAGRARARTVTAVDEGGRHCMCPVAGGVAGISQLVHSAGARTAPAAWPGRIGAQRDAPARGLGDHRVASVVRQGPGCVLASLRAAGAWSLS